MQLREQIDLVTIQEWRVGLQKFKCGQISDDRKINVAFLSKISI